jgi:beta-glucanase (GH16 family)
MMAFHFNSSQARRTSVGRVHKLVKLHTAVAIFFVSAAAFAQTMNNEPPRLFHARGWHSTFSDTFSGTTLKSCWKNSYTGDVHTLEGNKEAEWYASPGDGTGFQATSLHNGKLILQAIPTPPGIALPKKLPYLSGMIMSDGCFAQTYGYFEIRTKIPSGKGLWPAFWLLPASHKWPPEVDVFEMFGAPNSRKEGGIGWVHTGTVGGGQKAFNNWHQVSINQYQSFHRYGLLWGPDTMAIYIDGKRIVSQPTPAAYHQPMYLIVNLAVGGEWPELPDVSTIFPARMYVDYIKAWQYNAWNPSGAKAPLHGSSATDAETQ